MPWIQVYDPLGSPWLSTIVAALPIVHSARGAGRAGVAGAHARRSPAWDRPSPCPSSFTACRYRRRPRRRCTAPPIGLLPIGWIIVNAVFLYNLTVETGQFEIVKASVANLSADRRIQALLIAFSFGAFIEGAAGFGTPVAICSALLMGLGFTPLYSAGLALIANTAPVAFGAIGTPILTLAAVTGIPAGTLSAMAGRQLPFVSLIVPAWLVVTMSGWRGFVGVWPAVLVCGGVFAVVQFFWSNFVGPELVDIAGGLASLVALAVFCRVWKPSRSLGVPGSTRKIAPHRFLQNTGFAQARGRSRVDAVGVPQRHGHPLGSRIGQGASQRRPRGLLGLSRGRPPSVSSVLCSPAGTCHSSTAWSFATFRLKPSRWTAPASTTRSTAGRGLRRRATRSTSCRRPAPAS